MDFSALAAVFTLSGVLAFATQKIFIRHRKFDDYNHRTSHNTLATRTGGISLFATLFLVAMYYYAIREEIFDFSLLIPLGIMFIVGVYDDFYHADFKLKFLLQIIVAKIIIDQGHYINSFHGVFGIYELPWVISQIFTVFVFLVVVNAVNFIDGIDGLAITMVIKTILLIELLNVGHSVLWALGFLIVAALIPLYYFNFKKKPKIFLGDAGSLFLGTVVCLYVFHLLSPNFKLNSTFKINKALLSILVVLYPLVDLLRVFLIRIFQKKSPFMADQQHIHHYVLKYTKSHLITTLSLLCGDLLLSFFFYFILT